MLNSRDVYILMNGTAQHMWVGQGADDETIAHAKPLAAVLRSGGAGHGGDKPPTSCTQISEGKEPSAWTSALGTGQYANNPYLKQKKDWRYVDFVLLSR